MPNWTAAQRQERFRKVAGDDQRHSFERDRDRVLYSSAFHRLAGITQVVKAGEEDVFHTRQQHSYKVAQVGRRVAQNCRQKDETLAQSLGLHEEVVEAACLAHDLGHPPFGHVGESKLDDLMTSHDPDSEGFEGNAQSFRIITKLSVRFAQAPGLDLTRATLAACLKYPWLRDRNDNTKNKKWSSYKTEADEFAWTRQHHLHEHRTPEAHLMDWADDIAYSVHDLEDFHRCRAIPWDQILNHHDRQATIVEKALASWFDPPEGAKDMLEAALARLLRFLKTSFEPLFAAPYDGTSGQRQQLRTLTSTLIGRYVTAASLGDSETGVLISREEETEVKILKQITRDYIIANPSLSAQQHGYAKVIEFLFKAISESAGGAKYEVPHFLPHRMRYLWDLADGDRLRFAADSIASLTEKEALGLYARLNGSSSGSVLDPIVR